MILVTGAAGFIGSTLVDILSKSHQVVGIDNFTYHNQYSIQGFLSRPNFQFLKTDVRDINSYRHLLDKSHTVIHLSALVGASICDKNPTEAREINLDATVRLTEAFKGKIIYANTNSGYGASDEEICTEESPIKPVSLYGQTKLEAEKYVLDAGGVSFRLATVFGPSFRQRMDLMVNDFVSKLYFNGGITLFEPHFRRNFVHVKDVCQALMMGLDPDLAGVYNVGLDSANCTKIELAKKVAEIVNPKAVIQVGQGKDPDKRNYNVSSQKLIGKGFRANHSLETGISQVKTLCTIYTKNELDLMRNA